MNFLFEIILKIKIFFSDPYSVGKIYRKYYGVKIGENVRFTGKQKWSTESYLIEIGNNVTITQNVTFHTHDGGVGIFREEYPGINIFGRIKIGNNVFIGSNTIILPGVVIGDNVVIGCGSIVRKDIPPNCVAAGVPARPIKSISEYKEKVLSKAIYVLENDPKKRQEFIINNLK